MRPTLEIPATLGFLRFGNRFGANAWHLRNHRHAIGVPLAPLPWQSQATNRLHLRGELHALNDWRR